MLRIAVVSVALVTTLPVLAQTAPPATPTDQRLVQPAITALQGVLALREAEVRACNEDRATIETGYEARLAQVIEWLVASQKEHQARN